jgi:hypothetical protein
MVMKVNFFKLFAIQWLPNVSGLAGPDTFGKQHKKAGGSLKWEPPAVVSVATRRKFYSLGVGAGVGC